MKPLRLLALFLSLLAGLRAADAIQVAGVITMGPGKTMVRLVNATSGISSWVMVGDTFAGYRVQSYTASPDGRSDSVTLTGNGAPLRLTLASPKVRSTNARGGATTATPANAAPSEVNTLMMPANAEPASVPAVPPPPAPPAGN
jgi:hypothetical protein